MCRRDTQTVIFLVLYCSINSPTYQNYTNVLGYLRLTRKERQFRKIIFLLHFPLLLCFLLLLLYDHLYDDVMIIS